MERTSTRATWLAAALATVCAIHLLVPVESAVGRVTYALPVAAGAVVAWVGTWRRPPGARLEPGLVAAGLTSYVVGDLLWITLHLLHGSVDDASVADVAHFAAYLGLGGAVLVTLTRFGRAGGLDVDGLLDALTVICVSLLVFWTFSISDIVADPSAGPGERLVLAAYPVADALLIAFVVRGSIDRHSRAVFGPWFGLGVLAWLASDIAKLISTHAGTSVVTDLGWMVGAVLIACSTWRPPVPTPAEVRPGRGREGYAVRLGIAVVPLLVPPALDVVQHLGDDQDLGPAPFVGLAVLLVLAVVRLARLLTSESGAQRAAERSRRYFALLTDSSSDAVLVLDEHGDPLPHQPGRGTPTRAGDQAAHRALPAWFRLLAHADTEAMERVWREQVLTAPGQTFNAEIRADHRDGRPRWLNARMVNLLDDPDVGGVIVALSDITARKTVELELEEARDLALAGSGAKSAFLATMSHEIRTPMNGVIGLTELLLTTDVDDRQRQYADGVRVAGEALLTIIDDILDFSKIEAGHLELETTDLDPLRLVEETAELVSESARRKGLELLAHCSPDLPARLHGDPGRLRQVLLNLAANAVKFTDSGEVVLAARPTTPADRVAAGDLVTIRFEVTDTGIGLHDEDRDRLFDAFSQADSSTTRRFGGTGLGLAISRQLVTAMGGRIGVDSAPGEGSTFWFTLPMVVGEVAPVSPGSDRVLADARVLVVDRHRTSRLVLGEQLSAWGMRADTVDDAAAALERIARAQRAEDPYAVVVVDGDLPGVDGVELARRVVAASGPTRPRLVLLAPVSGTPGSPETDHGADALLSKPVRRHRLRDTLVEVLTPAPATDRGSAEPGPGRTSARGHVLVVEDSEINQLVAVGILEHLGFTAEVAEDGAAALVALERQVQERPDFDAVLMDCRMPVLDGYDATRELRRREAGGRRTPVIAMTANVVEGDRERCLAAGMDDYVAKPVTPDTVEAALLRWVPTA